MGTLTEFLSGLKRIDESCFSIFSPYYQERAKHYIHPVFYQSIVQMIAANGFFYKIFRVFGRSVLVIFKRSTIMGNYSLMMHIAPISLEGKVQDEVQVIQNARRLGISAKLCMEDLQRYKIPVRLCDQIKGNIEYLYNANECYEAKGGKFHNFRRQIKRITKLEDYAHKFGASGDIDRLVERWDKHNHSEREKRNQTSQLSDWRNIKKIHNERVHIHSIYVAGVLECFSVIEQLSEKHWVLVMGMRNYDSNLNDVNVCMHWLDCKIAHRDNIPAVYANMGASLGITGLSEAKEKLKPCAHNQIFKMPAVGKLNVNEVKQIFRNI